MTVTERIFDALNANPDATIDELEQGDNRSTVSAARTFWRKTRHKSYTNKSTVVDPVEKARRIIYEAPPRGVSEFEARDLAIDAGVAHGTAFSVAAQVYRDHRALTRGLKGARGTWTVTTESGLELPVGHNVRVDWSRDDPTYEDEFYYSSKRYQRWLSALECGYIVVQKGKVQEGMETLWRDGYLGIYRIEDVVEERSQGSDSVTVHFRMTHRLAECPETAGPAPRMERISLKSGDEVLRAALLRLARTAEATTKQSGRERVVVSKWKEFGFLSPDEMADHLETLYNKQQGLCALTGIEMTKRQGDWHISPDRIDSDGDYTRDNLQLVARCVNFMKGSTPNDVFITWLNAIRAVSSTTSRALRQEAESVEI